MPNLPYSTPGWSNEVIVGPRKLEYPFANSPTPDVYARRIRRPFEIGGEFSPRIATRTSATNLALHSSDLTNGYWTASALTPAANVVANPENGLITAGSLTETTGTLGHYVFSSAMAITANANILWRGFFKAGTSSRVQLTIYDGVSSGFYANFNLSSGSVTKTGSLSTGSYVGSGMISAGGGWYLCYVVGKADAASTSATGYIIGLNSDTASPPVLYTGSTSNVFYYWNLQFENATTTVSPNIATGAAVHAITAPDLDYLVNTSAQGRDLFAYLVEESELDVVNSALARFSRTYARIPATQYEPLSKMFVRPSLHDVKSGSSYGASFDDGKTSHVFGSRIAVSSLTDQDVPTTPNPSYSGTKPLLPGGITINLVGGAGSSSFSTSDSISTIESALDSAMGASIWQVVKDNYSIKFYANGAMYEISCTDSRIRINGLPQAYGSAGVQVIEIAPADANAASARDVVTGSAHGGSAGEWFAAWNGDKLVGISKAISASGTAMSINLADFPGSDLVITHIAFASQATVRVVNGPIECSARLVRRFYLPGVTLDVSSFADIPSFAPVIDPVAWFGVLLAYIAAPSASTYAIESTIDLKQWMGPILEKAVIEIQVQDAYVTASKTA